MNQTLSNQYADSVILCLASAWHVPDGDLKLPKIPVTPIGSIDAQKYLSKMGGHEVNRTWKGGLNLVYRYGPGLNAQYRNR